MDLPAKDQAPPHPLLQALARFESVAALYPSTHTRVIEAGAELLAAIRACCGATGAVQITNVRGHLLVQSAEVHDNGAAARRLREEFDALGLVALEIASSVTTDDLHAFARIWRSTVQGLANTHGLHTAELGELPATIRAHHREFGQRVALCEVAADQAAEPVAVAASRGSARDTCQRMLDKTMRRVAARMQTLDAPLPPQAHAPDARSLDDVLQITARVLQEAIERYLAESGEARGLRKLFDSVELATALSPDAESARLLLDVLKESAEEVLEGEAAEAEQAIAELEPDPEHYERTIEALRTELAEAGAGPGLEGLELDDRSECLSILFELADGSRATRSKNSLGNRLRRAIAEPLGASERETVQAAIKDFCARADADALDRTLPELAAALGESQAQAWLAPLVEVAAAADVARLEVLWPHLANQLLLGPRARTEKLLAGAVEHIARLPRAKLSAGIRRLQHLEALLERHVSRHAFAPPRAELANLYVALLGTTHGSLVGAHLLAHLRAHPDKWPGARVFACIRDCDRECCELMARMFAAQNRSERIQVELAAARMLASKLEGLPRESRNAAWIAPALEWLGQFDASETVALLGRIVGERRMVLVPQWPSACREAASRALARVRARTGELDR